MTIGIRGMGVGSLGESGSRSMASRGRELGGLGARDVADDLVDDPVFLGLDGGQVAVALGVLGDPLDRLAAVLGEDLVDRLPAPYDLLGLDLDVGDLSADLAVG